MSVATQIHRECGGRKKEIQTVVQENNHRKQRAGATDGK